MNYLPLLIFVLALFVIRWAVVRAIALILFICDPTEEEAETL
jgi:hypothetical protein